MRPGRDTLPLSSSRSRRRIRIRSGKRIRFDLEEKKERKKGGKKLFSINDIFSDIWSKSSGEDIGQANISLMEDYLVVFLIL